MTDKDQVAPVDGKKQALLIEHRRLALCRAHLADRTRVLRRLAELEKDNEGWKKDLSLYERTRLREIQGAADRVFAELDLDALQLLQRELKENWRDPAVGRMRLKVEDYVRQLQLKDATYKLEATVAQLSETMATGNVAEARRIREELQVLKDQIKALGGLGDSHAK